MEKSWNFRYVALQGKKLLWVKIGVGHYDPPPPPTPGRIGLRHDIWICIRVIQTILENVYATADVITNIEALTTVAK